MKSSKELLGFNDAPWIVFAILSSSFLFPIVFLGESLSKWASDLPWSYIGGIIYASIMYFGNRTIIFHFIEKRRTAGVQYQLGLQLTAHFIFSVAIAVFMSWLLSQSDPMHDFTLEHVLRNIIGCITILGIVAGMYEGSFWFAEWKRSVAVQERLRRENLQSQLETLKNQVNPHFLFNSLNTLVSIIPEKPEVAVEYVRNLSSVYRYVLELKDKRLVSIADEMRCIDAYCFMLHIRFEDKLKIETKLDDLDSEFHIVPLSLQLLIENAIKHNVTSLKKPLLIEIFPNLEAINGPRLIVRNNYQPKKQVTNSTGTGLENIQSRYDILSGDRVDVLKTNEYFTVTLPMIKVKNYQKATPLKVEHRASNENPNTAAK